ncbi:MAG TPA: MlaD family protein [Chitinispirillaceae bacterium]|nr:MlaD family protein [Chitinispirillaceae bacterium]
MQNPPKRKVITWSQLMLPVFLTIALALATFTIFFSGAISNLFQQKFKLTISITEVGGLRLGAPVWMQGLTVGTVSEMDFKGKNILISISVRQKYRQYLYKNAHAEVKAIGLLGSKYVELFRGTEEQGSIASGQTIRGQLVDPLRNIDENFNTTIKDLSSIFNKIANGKGVTGALINDSTFASEVEQTIVNVNKILEELRKNPRKFFKIEIF